jgi:HAE1 family hydrophobic/amphiphilic exporter-1
VRLAELSLRRPVFAAMLNVALIGLGWVSLQRLGVDFFPKVEPPVVTVTTVLEGASPETVETEVTEVLEEEISNLGGLDSLVSKSSEGLSQVMASFEMGTPADVAAQDVRDKVALARRDLPPDIEPPLVERLDPDAQPILSVMIAGERPVGELTRFADDVVKERLQRVPGVGSVTLAGGREREVRIWLDAYRLRAYGLTAQDAIRAIQTEHAEIPGGRLESAGRTAEFSFKTRGEVESVAEFGEIVVAQRDGPIRLRDIARVEDGLADERTYAELDGIPGVALDVRRQSGRNTVEVAHALNRELDAIRAQAPPDVRLAVARDISRFIESSVNDVFVDLVLGGVLAVLVTLAFLRNLRSTLIVATAIPVSVVSTFLLFYAVGFTLNLLTMIALTISIGILIDDAIVVVEAIYRRIEAGESPREAAARGTREVGLAVVAATAAIVVVFVPIAFIRDSVGRLFFEYGVTVVFAVSVSLLVAFTLTPVLSARLLHRHGGHGGLFERLERGYAALEAGYARLLGWALARRPLVLGVAVASVVVAVALGRTIPLEFTSHVDRGEIEAKVELPLGTGIEETKRVARRVQTALAGLEHVRSVFATVGAGVQGRVNEASLYLRLTPKRERDQGQQEVMARARAVVREAAPEARRTLVSEISFISGGGFTGFNLQYSLRGPNLDRLDELAQQIAAAMRASREFVDIKLSYETGKPEVQATVDRRRAADLGIELRTLATTLRAMVGGVDVATYQEDGERHDVRVRLEESQRDELPELGLVQVRAGDGSLVDLDNVAALRVGTGPVQIDREDRSRKIDIFANTPPGVALGTAMTRLDAIVAEVGLPDGYSGAHRSWGERVEEMSAAARLAAILALSALYMVLASQFNSYSQPLVIMTTAPLSLAGAFIALALTRHPLGALAQVALLGLMGLVMRNGILLVDCANQLRARGSTPADAIRSAGPVRLRPVLMTALAAIGGMVPVAFSRADGAEFRTAMGILAIGGMLSSTALTLVVVPVVYTYLEELRERAVGLSAALPEWLARTGPGARAWLSRRSWPGARS